MTTTLEITITKKPPCEFESLEELQQYVKRHGADIPSNRTWQEAAAALGNPSPEVNADVKGKGDKVE